MIYLVVEYNSCGCGPSMFLDGVFSTMEKAEEFIKNNKSNQYDDWKIEVKTLDPETWEGA